MLIRKVLSLVVGGHAAAVREAPAAVSKIRMIAVGDGVGGVRQELFKLRAKPPHRRKPHYYSEL